MTDPVMTWWLALVAVALLNAVAWGASAWRLRSVPSGLPAPAARTRRVLLWLSAGYAAGCAFRSVLPMVDVPRMCLHDTALSFIAAGRTVATVAELCFAAQIALLLREAGEGTAQRPVILLSAVLVPLIVVAEVFSWTAVLTSNYLLHAVENGLWTLGAALALAGFLSVRSALDERGRRFVTAVIVCGFAYVVFMALIDVPMYVARWQADVAAGRQTLALSAGVQEVLQRCTVVREWAAWRSDVPWLTLYFSVAVWISIALPHAPLLARASRATLRPPAARTPRSIGQTRTD